MKKIIFSIFCYGISLLLLLGFIVHTIVDYIRYDQTLNSAPFYIWVVVNAVYFIIPAILVFTVDMVLRAKNKAKNV